MDELNLKFRELKADLLRCRALDLSKEQVDNFMLTPGTDISKTDATPHATPYSASDGAASPTPPGRVQPSAQTKTWSATEETSHISDKAIEPRRQSTNELSSAVPEVEPSVRAPSTLTAEGPTNAHDTSGQVILQSAVDPGRVPNDASPGKPRRGEDGRPQSSRSQAAVLAPKKERIRTVTRTQAFKKRNGQKAPRQEPLLRNPPMQPPVVKKMNIKGNFMSKVFDRSAPYTSQEELQQFNCDAFASALGIRPSNSRRTGPLAGLEIDPLRRFIDSAPNVVESDLEPDLKSDLDSDSESAALARHQRKLERVENDKVERKVKRET